jgi:hypothetical protein
MTSTIGSTTSSSRWPSSTPTSPRRTLRSSLRAARARPCRSRSSPRLSPRPRRSWRSCSGPHRQTRPSPAPPAIRSRLRHRHDPSRLIHRLSKLPWHRPSNPGPSRRSRHQQEQRPSRGQLSPRRRHPARPPPVHPHCRPRVRRSVLRHQVAPRSRIRTRHAIRAGPEACLAAAGCCDALADAQAVEFGFVLAAARSHELSDAAQLLVDLHQPGGRQEAGECRTVEYPNSTDGGA